MKKPLRSFAVAALSLGLLLLLPPRCPGSPSDGAMIEGLDPRLTAGTLEGLPSGEARTLAVYYFTVGGKVSGLSDLLINDLTTSLATAGRGRVQVVSRRVLDRILSETSFQLSDLVRTDAQVTLGRMLGADLILTGFIEPVADHYRLNAQVVEVQSGVVVTGQILDFRLEAEFARRLESTPTSAGSEVVTAPRQAAEVAGTGTVTTIFENFDVGAPEVQVTPKAEFWGDRQIIADAQIDLVEKGGLDNSGFARAQFEGVFDSDNVPEDWEQSDLYFNTHINLGQRPRSFDGVSLSLRPQGFSVGSLALVQETPQGQQRFYLDVLLNENEWQSLNIPFTLFQPEDPTFRLDPEMPVALELSIPFTSNYHVFRFRGGPPVQASVDLDNLGLFQKKSPDQRRVLETFNDDFQRMSFYAELYGSSVYTDYRENDQGTVKVNPGVKDQKLSLHRVEGGASGEGGRHLALNGQLSLNERIREFHQDEQVITLFLKTSVPGDFKGFRALSFYVVSDLLTAGEIELQDLAHERYYYADFGVTGFWSRVRIPFESLRDEQGSLLEVESWPERFDLNLIFEMPPQKLEKAAASDSGNLDFSLGLDDFLLEE
jgi:TolB-like protein